MRLHCQEITYLIYYSTWISCIRYYIKWKSILEMKKLELQDRLINSYYFLPRQVVGMMTFSNLNYSTVNGKYYFLMNYESLSGRIYICFTPSFLQNQVQCLVMVWVWEANESLRTLFQAEEGLYMKTHILVVML